MILRLSTSPFLFTCSPEDLAFYFTETLEVLRSNENMSPPHLLICLYLDHILCLPSSHLPWFCVRPMFPWAPSPCAVTYTRVLLQQLSCLLHHQFLLLALPYQPTNVLQCPLFKKKQTFLDPWSIKSDITGKKYNLLRCRSTLSCVCTVD